MKKLFRYGLLLCGVGVTGVAGFFAWHFFKPVPQVTGALPDSAYVWQYRWTDGVTAAVRAAGDDAALKQLLVVAAEIMPGGDAPKIRAVLPDYKLLASLQIPIALVIRIGAHGGSFERDNPMSCAVTRAVCDSLELAKKSGWTPAEIQLDFDCPTRCLADYAQWILQVKEVTGEIPVTVTALPTWLGARDFRKVIDAADGYVLQVHSVFPLPKKGDVPPLCDTARARRWVTQAARLGKPFRVALPTYTYRVGIDAKGNHTGVTAEAPEKELAGVTAWRFMAADAPSLAALIKEWQVTHPAMLSGVVWYRLPVSGDQLNWTWAAWNKVRSGDVPVTRIESQWKTADGLLQDLFLKNTGDLAVVMPSKIKITWENSTVTAADAIGGYAIVSRSDGAIVFRRTSPSPSLLNPEEEFSFGWMRFTQVPQSMRMNFE